MIQIILVYSNSRALWILEHTLGVHAETGWGKDDSHGWAHITPLTMRAPLFLFAPYTLARIF